MKFKLLHGHESDVSLSMFAEDTIIPVSVCVDKLSTLKAEFQFLYFASYSVRTGGALHIRKQVVQEECEEV